MNRASSRTWRLWAASAVIGVAAIASGCVAISPQPGCSCGAGAPIAPGPSYSLSQFKRDFTHLVIGGEDEPQVASQTRRAARAKIVRTQAIEHQEAPLVTLADEAAMESPEVLPAPPAVSDAGVCLDEPSGAAPPAELGPADAGPPADCELPLPPVVLGPPGRFFPVPARPVFSPPAAPCIR